MRALGDFEKIVVHFLMELGPEAKCSQICRLFTERLNEIGDKNNIFNCLVRLERKEMITVRSQRSPRLVNYYTLTQLGIDALKESMDRLKKAGLCG